MPNINITVAEKIATNMSPGVNIVCGNSDYIIVFSFDSEWREYPIKTARFVYTRDGKVEYKEAVFAGNEVPVPVMSNVLDVYVGVYAGELHTTTPARVLCDRSILCSGGTHEAPQEDVYNQILEAANKIVGQSASHVTDKNNPHGVTAAQVGAAPASHATDKNNPHGVTAAQVGAAPASHAADKNNPHGVTAAQVGAAPASHAADKNNPHGVTAAQVGAATPDDVKKAAPQNLLDNSDFRNPVNQRGKTSYASSGYTIDRWKIPGAITIDVLDSSVKLTCTSTSTANGMSQYYEHPPTAGTKLTVAMMEANGTLHVGSATMPSSNYNVALTTTNGVKVRLVTDRMTIMVPVGESIELKWVALYEGEYTAETIPEYQPKGYGAELLECQRYYYKVDTMGAFGYAYSASIAYAVFITPVEMRAIPNITCSDDIVHTIRIGGTKYDSGITFTGQVYKNRNQLRASLDISESGMTGNHSFTYMKSGGTLEFSADLGV